MNAAHAARVWMLVASLIIAAMAGGAAVPAGYAADSSSTPSASATSSGSSSSSSSSSGDAVTVTDNITDTENLLGDNLGKVSDALDRVKKEDGVTVKLMFLPKFVEGKDPNEWAKEVLKATNPAPNTVLLAVASEDGNLVVAVSANSDDWLSSKESVDSLSKAAWAPLNEDTPDWSGSAIALATQISALKKSSSSSRFSTVGIIVFVIALVALAAAATAFVVIHRRRKARVDRQLARRERRRSARRNAGPANDPANGSAGGPDATSSNDSTNDSADIQETSSTEGHA
ncbi:TPM domain-containing protein [Bifidobacterium sp. SMB2]|uniref:TPM domain-containing protein n=1 Tax=Bifidobacterium saimiriisciurei TaxID=2661627 RepID=A0ABX0CGX1_9BIFI|nr:MULTISPECIES: TPM domain-containing protein [Bifidobacterium]NEG95615.1 TPM domain-containing protein [Bifidobacterium sp. SMB2]NEH11928.1 TPM domain-containing protein [Bifidobacterium saimiriisciurei]